MHVIRRFSNYADRGKWLLVLDSNPSHVIGAVLTSRATGRCPSFVRLEANMAVAVPNIVSLPRDTVIGHPLSPDRASDEELEQVAEVIDIILGRAEPPRAFYEGVGGDERHPSPYPGYEQWTVLALSEGYSHLAGLYVVISTTDFNRRYFRSQSLVVPLAIARSGEVLPSPLADVQDGFVLEPIIDEVSAIDWRFYLRPCDKRFPRAANGTRRARKIASHRNPPNALGAGASTVLPDNVEAAFRSRCLACEREILDVYDPWPRSLALYPRRLRAPLLEAVETRLRGAA